VVGPGPGGPGEGCGDSSGAAEEPQPLGRAGQDRLGLSGAAGTQSHQESGIALR